MTEQYQQKSINLDIDSEMLELFSFDERDVPGLVPTGTTATYQKYRLPVAGRLSRLSWSGVLAPNAAESVQLRLYRVRPQSNPAGFGYIQLNDVFTVNSATFTDAGGDIDISSAIRANRFVFPGEYLAASWVHSGPQQLQPLNMNWNFTPISLSANEPEPPADTIVYSDVFG